MSFRISTRAFFSASGVIALLLGTSVLADEPTPQEVISLNNVGVKEINKEHWQSAAEKFEDALKIDPQYRLARQNWAITELHWGVHLKAEPAVALIHLHKAYLLNDNSPSVLNETEKAVKALRLNPRLFADRVKLAEEAERNADLTGAAVEYFAALSLHKDSKTQMKFDTIFEKLPPYFRKPLVQNWTNLSPALFSPVSTQPLLNQNYGTYLSRFENNLKTRWAPQSESVSRRAVVACDVNVVEHSSHDSQFDEQVQQLIRTVANFGTLPKEAHGGLQIQIVFDYDAIAKVKRVEAEAKRLLSEK
jgi:hypothetical protein